MSKGDTDTAPLPLAAGFPQADEAAWRALVEKALRGRDFEETLVSRTYDGLRIEPLYPPASGARDSGVPGFAPYSRGLRAAKGEPAWHICQLHAEDDAAAANAEILEDLKGGVTAITLQTAAPGQFGLERSDAQGLAAALNGVHLDFAPVYLASGSRFPQVAVALQEVWRARGVGAESVSGGFDADPLGALARAGGYPVAMEEALAQAVTLARVSAQSLPKMTALLADARLYHDAGASEAQELACLCATLVTYLRALEEGGLAPEQALPEIRLALACDTDQFLSIAKLRAARMLVARIAAACGAEAALGEVRLHASTSHRMMARRNPYVNLLRTVMACSAAVIGGADSITVLPFTWVRGKPDRLARRLARNIQIILQEESALGRVMDPAGGSGYVEELTRALAQKAWGLFQEIEKAGGMPRALQSGFVQSMVAETAARRAEAVGHAAQELVGINAFPQLGENPRMTEPHPLPPEIEDPAITVEPVPLRRVSEPFEILRDASLRHYDRFGARPKIFLACLGTPSDYLARVAYARQFFMAAGLVAVESDPLNTPEQVREAFVESKCHLICLCSSDEVYTHMAEGVAREVSKALPYHLYLAGRPGENREALRKAGVETFIHKGCDMLEILRDALDYLGIRP